ncbi:MAG: hypothetical protein QNJ72_00775 [Pleurocapsa sp. MO_226.B13]|nr:hypothetical protein [Pleurocapsa sp. MO_226.B13]
MLVFSCQSAIALLGSSLKASHISRDLSAKTEFKKRAIAASRRPQPGG